MQLAWTGSVLKYHPFGYKQKGDKEMAISSCFFKDGNTEISLLGHSRSWLGVEVGVDIFKPESELLEICRRASCKEIWLGGQRFSGWFRNGYDPSLPFSYLRSQFTHLSPFLVSPQISVTLVREKPCLHVIKKSLINEKNRPKPEGHPLRFFFRVGHGRQFPCLGIWVLGHPNGLPQSFSGHP